MTARKPKAPPTGRDAIPFAPKNKGYYRDPVSGEQWTRVTTILDKGVPKEALIFWAANTCTQSALDNLPWLVTQSRSSTGIQEAYDHIRRAHTRKKDERADIGSAVHALIESHVLGTPIPDEIRDNPEMAPFRRHFERFVHEWEIEFTATEMVVANPEHGWCGTLDYLFRSSKAVDAINRFRTAKGQLLVTEVWGLDPLDPAAEMSGDTKTGGELDAKGIYDTVGLQMSAYGHARYCWLRDGTRLDMPSISPVGVALHLRPEGYRLIPVRCDDAQYEVFRHAQAVAEWSMTLAKTVTGGTNWSAKEGLAAAALQLPTPQPQKEAS